MDDKCVVCGEADEGKPLYKKLGSGEHNVEIFEALHDLQLTSLPESAKNDHYICWDCDETIVAEYGRYLENEEKEKAAKEVAREKRRVRRAEQRKKRRIEKQQQLTEGPKNHVLKVTPLTTNNTNRCSKTKKLEIQRASNAHHSTHCLMCDSTFDSNSRAYQRFSLKKMVNDDMDVARVMEHLGLARRIAPEMKGKRFVCTNCYYTIRRNYKDKLLKGSSIQEKPSNAGANSKKDPIHRATPDEHAAEIAKLLPPALAECYKIMTSNSFENVADADAKKKGRNDADGKKKGRNVKVKANDGGSAEEAKTDVEVEDEEGLRVSQDEHGNYVIDMKIDGSPKRMNDKTVSGADGKKVNNTREPQVTPRKKNNVLLPKRHHRHLSEETGSGPVLSTENVCKTTDAGNTGEESNLGDPSNNSGTCNICGRTFSGKPDDWWHNLNSSLSGFESITISMALQLLETSLANTSEKARLACQVCFPCYGMVSTGFRSQVGQRIARQKNISASDVNFLKVKVRMVSKEQLEGLKGTASNSEIESGKVALSKTEEKKMANHEGNFRDLKNLDKDSNKKGLKRKIKTVGETGLKKLKINNNAGIMYSIKGSEAKSPVYKNTKNVSFGGSGSGDSDSSDSSDSSSEDLDTESSLSESNAVDMEAQLQSSGPNYEQSSGSDVGGGKKRGKQDLKVKGTSPNLKNSSAGHKVNRSDISVASSTCGSTAPAKESTSDVRQRDLTGVPSKRELCDGNRTGTFRSEMDDNIGKRINGEAKVIRSYDVNGNCGMYFSLSKMKEAKVVLNDMRHSLPEEAFEGNTLHVRAISKKGYSISICKDVYPSSPFQFILKSMFMPNKNLVTGTSNPTKDTSDGTLMYGRCVVCATTSYKSGSIWHTVEEDINPPYLLVPVRWVCASLNIPPVKLSEREKEAGKVCDGCFASLTKQFNEFVVAKIGESCDQAPDDVDVSEYIVTFNQETMNIEADPVEYTPEEELEEAEKILQKILPVLQSFSLNDLVVDSSWQPLAKKEYNTWLLLTLNDFRIQVGASMQDLIGWLARLMPSEMCAMGLTPCEDGVIRYIRSVAMSWDIRNKESLRRLNFALPMSLFVRKHKTASAPDQPKGIVEPKKEIKEEVKQENSETRELKWESFLSPVDLDKLFEGTAPRLPRKAFNNGLLYALWRVLLMIGGDDAKLTEWLKQISPIPLEKDHLKLLISAPRPIHEHLEKHPEDLDKLNCVIIPEPTVTSKSNSHVKPSGSVSSKPGGSNAPSKVNSLTAKGTTSSVAQMKNVEKPRPKGQTTSPVVTKHNQLASTNKRKRSSNAHLHEMSATGNEPVDSPPQRSLATKKKARIPQSSLATKKKARIRRRPKNNQQKLTNPNHGNGTKKSEQDYKSLNGSPLGVSKSLPPSKTNRHISHHKAISGNQQSKLLELLTRKDQVTNTSASKARASSLGKRKVKNTVTMKRKINGSGSSQAENCQNAMVDQEEEEGVEVESIPEKVLEDQKNDHEAALMLARKVKEMERQLQAMKKENQELKNMNQKLKVVATSSDESEGNSDKGKENALLEETKEVSVVDKTDKESGCGDVNREINSPDESKEIGSPGESKEIGSPDESKEIGSPDESKEIGSLDESKEISSLDDSKEISALGDRKEVSSLEKNIEVKSTDKSREVCTEKGVQNQSMQGKLSVHGHLPADEPGKEKYPSDESSLCSSAEQTENCIPKFKDTNNESVPLPGHDLDESVPLPGHDQVDTPNKGCLSTQGEAKFDSKEVSIVQKECVKIEPSKVRTSPVPLGNRKKILNRTNSLTVSSPPSSCGQKTEVTSELGSTPKELLEPIDTEKVPVSNKKSEFKKSSTPASSLKARDSSGKVPGSRAKPKPRFEDLMNYDM